MTVTRPNRKPVTATEARARQAAANRDLAEAVAMVKAEGAIRATRPIVERIAK